jgi:hypothetical protein
MPCLPIELQEKAPRLCSELRRKESLIRFRWLESPRGLVRLVRKLPESLEERGRLTDE